MILYHNTVSPMQVTLPGEPKSQGYNNAQAHVDSIVGAYALVRASQGNFVDWDIIGPEGRDLLPELLWNDGDGTMVLREAVEQYCIEQPLSITERWPPQQLERWLGGRHTSRSSSPLAVLHRPSRSRLLISWCVLSTKTGGRLSTPCPPPKTSA